MRDSAHQPVGFVCVLVTMWVKQNLELFRSPLQVGFMYVGKMTWSTYEYHIME